MSINLPVPNDIEPRSLSQLLSDMLRRTNDATTAFATGSEPTYVPTNAPTSGRKYRIGVIEVTDPDTQVISGALTVTLV